MLVNRLCERETVKLPSAILSYLPPCYDNVGTLQIASWVLQGKCRLTCSIRRRKLCQDKRCVNIECEWKSMIWNVHKRYVTRACCANINWNHISSWQLYLKRTDMSGVGAKYWMRFSFWQYKNTWVRKFENQYDNRTEHISNVAVMTWHICLFQSHSLLFSNVKWKSV